MELMNMFKQLKDVQESLSTMQDEVSDFETEGTAGGGMVRVTLSGKGQMTKLWIDSELFKEDDKEILEDLILAAHNDAKAKNEKELQQKTQEAMGKMELPGGMKLPF